MSLGNHDGAGGSLTILPPCDYRLRIPDRPTQHFCQHTKIQARGQLVWDKACLVCPQRLRPSDGKREPTALFEPMYAEPPKSLCQPSRLNRWLTRIAGKPGDALKSFIFIATDGKANHGMGCELERQRMNNLSWHGCWRDRERIWERLRKEAEREQIPLTAWRVAGYVVKVVWRACKQLV